jgi:hypothetical protein
VTELAWFVAGALLGSGATLAADLWVAWRRAAADPGPSRREQAIYDAGWGAGYTWAALHPEPIERAYRIDPPSSGGGGR